AISTISSRSAGVWARSVTVPSLRTGTFSGQVRSVTVAGGVGGVHPEHLDVSGEERQFLQRTREWHVVGMSVDLGQELGCGEMSADHVALQFRHVDAVGRETAQRLVQ